MHSKHQRSSACTAASIAEQRSKRTKSLNENTNCLIKIQLLIKVNLAKRNDIFLITIKDYIIEHSEPIKNSFISKLTWVICAEPRQRVDRRLTVVETEGTRHLSSFLSVLPSLRTNSSIRPLIWQKLNWYLLASHI